MKALVMFHPHRLDCGVLSLTDLILTSTTLIIHNTFYYGVGLHVDAEVRKQMNLARGPAMHMHAQHAKG